MPQQNVDLPSLRIYFCHNERGEQLPIKNNDKNITAMKTFTRILVIWTLLVCIADLYNAYDYITWGTKGISELAGTVNGDQENKTPVVIA